MALKRETISKLLDMGSMMSMLLIIICGICLFIFYGEWFLDIKPDASLTPWLVVGFCATYFLLLAAKEAQELVERIRFYRNSGGNAGV